MTADTRELLAEAYADADEVLRPRVADLEQQLAAAQANNKVLRDALEWVQNRSANNHIVDEALSVLFDDNALKAALEAERKRCIAAIIVKHANGSYKYSHREECVEAIFALGDQ